MNMNEKSFTYYQFDGDGPKLAVAIIGKDEILSYETDGLHDGGECLGWLEGVSTGYQRAINQMAKVFDFEEVKYEVEEISVCDIKDLKLLKKRLSKLTVNLWSSEMEECLELEIEAKENNKEALLAKLEDGEQYYYCWGFSGVDNIDEESIFIDVEPDFIHRGTQEEAEIAAFWQGVEDLEGYRGLHGVPDDNVDEDEFLEYANDNVVIFVEEKIAFDEEHKDTKEWELEI